MRSRSWWAARSSYVVVARTVRQNETDFRPQEANSNSSNRIRKWIASTLQIGVSDPDELIR